MQHHQKVVDSQVATLISSVALLMDKYSQLASEYDTEKRLFVEKANKYDKDQRFYQMMCNDQQKQMVALSGKIEELAQKNIGAVKEDLATASRSIYKEIEGVKAALATYKNNTNKRLEANTRDLTCLSETVSERYLQSTLESRGDQSRNVGGSGLDKTTTNKQNPSPRSSQNIFVIVEQRIKERIDEYDARI